MPTARRERLAGLEARAEAAEAAKIELSLKVAELAAAAAEQQADVDAAPSGRRRGGNSADSGSEATGAGEEGEGDPLLQRAEEAELAAAAAGRRAAAAEAEVDKLKVGAGLFVTTVRYSVELDAHALAASSPACCGITGRRACCVRRSPAAAPECACDPPQFHPSALPCPTFPHFGLPGAQVSLADAEKRAKELAFQVKMMADLAGSPGALLGGVVLVG